MNHKTRVYENVFEMLPNEENPTPLVRLNKLNRCAEFPLYAKLEWMNPFGSVKDRAAWEPGDAAGDVQPPGDDFRSTA